MPRYHGTWVRDLGERLDADAVEGLADADAKPERETNPASGVGAVDAGMGQQYIQLEDLTAPFARPSVMDIKVGVQAWDEDASPAKIAKEASKYPTQQLVGFRMTGMRVWDRRRTVRQQPDGSYESCAGHYREHGRAFGYKLTQATLGEGFREFLSDGERVRYEAVPPFLDRLLAIRHWMAGQAEFRLYGSSLLFIYEGNAPAGAPPHVDLRLIDFAHVWPIQPRLPESEGAGESRLHESAEALTDEQEEGWAEDWGSEQRSSSSSMRVEGSAGIPQRSSDGAGTVRSRSRAAPITSEERDSGYLLGLDSIINYLLALLATREPELAAWYQLKWEEQDRLPGSRPVLVHGHHFHHTTPEGDAAALSFTPPGAATADVPGSQLR